MNKSLIFALCTVIFFVVMNNTLPLMAAPYIASELGASSDIAVYVVVFYSIGNAVGLPIAGALPGRMSYSHFFLLSLLLLSFFSLAAALSPNYPVFLLVRFLQGVVAGTQFPVVSRIFFTLIPKEKKIRMNAILIAILTASPALSAGWGGWIAYDYHWQNVFYSDVPIMFLLALFLWRKLQEVPLPAEKLPFDWIGYLFFVIAVVSFSLVITMGQELDWQRSPLIVTLSVLSIVCGLFFILWELNHPFPIFDFSLLKNLAFSFALLNLALLFAAYFGMVILLAYWLNLWVSYTPIWIGLIVGVMFVAGLFSLFMFEKGYARIDCRIPLAIAIILLGVSSFYVSFFNEEIDFGRIAFSRLLAGFGLAFFLTPIFRLLFYTYPAEKTLAVVNFFQLSRMLGSGLGAAAYVTIWQRREVFFHERLGSQLTAFSGQTQAYFLQAKAFGLEGQRSLAELNHLLNRASVALALDDCFYLIGYIMVGLLVLLLLTGAFRCKGFLPEQEQLLEKQVLDKPNEI